ncbi:MAG: PIN domain-containing protein [Anaerolineae bacterium]|nr:PIN domain-containing protein [Anaerolineae bacterium]
MRAIIDTNVVFEGLTTRGSAAGVIVDAWMARLFVPCVSTALAYEYATVLARKLSEQRWQVVSQVLDALLDRAEFTPIYYSWRPSSPDRADEHVVDCAMNAGACVVTSNVRDFALAHRELGLGVLTPAEFVALLVDDPERSG